MFLRAVPREPRKNGDRMRPSRTAAAVVGGILALCWCALSPCRAYAQDERPQDPLTQEVSAGEVRPLWHLPEWQFREIVEVVNPAAGKGLNTGSARPAASPPQVMENGRDVRVMDEEGRPVRFEWVDQQRKSTTEPFAEGAVPRLHFEVADPEVRRYIIYFGNKNAQSATENWAKRLGGLTLETWDNPKRRNAPNFKYMQRLISWSKQKFGQGPRRQINDPENPFGQDAYYLSIYRGDIYCPVAGKYGFATDSDDSSFLNIDGKLVVQWPGGHSPSGTFDHHGEVQLAAGAHKIEYYHAQARGGALAKAGWRPPGAKKFVLIPEEAFLLEVQTRSVALERRDGALNAYFTCEEIDSLQFGSAGPAFVTLQFHDRSISALSRVVSREWDFGDGTVSREENPRHTFPCGREQVVTLKCVDLLGYESTWTKKLDLPPTGMRRVDVAMEAVPDETFLLTGESLHLKVKCGNASEEAIVLTLVTEVRNASGELVYRRREPVSVPADGWVTRECRSEEGFGGFETGNISLRLEHAGEPVAEYALVLRQAADPSIELQAAQDGLTDEHGTPVVLRLSGKRARAGGSTVRRTLEQARAVHLLAVDDSLAGSGEKNYLDFLADRLRSRFPAGEVRITHIGRSDNGTRRLHNPLAGLVEYPGLISEAKPDVVIIAGSLRDVLRFTSVHHFGRSLHALMDRISAAYKGELVLIAPPPAAANPGLARAYAIAVKRLGLHAGVGVADAYSAFLRASGVEFPFAEKIGEWQQAGWLEFYRDPESSAPIYHISPTERGQELIAAALEETLLAGPPSPRGHR